MIARFQKLPVGAKIALMLGGGVTLFVVGVSTLGGSDDKKPPRPTPPNPGPGPEPPPIPLKGVSNVTYRGVTATYGQDPADPAIWILVYAINGEKAAITVRTNESGIIERFNKAVDTYFANVKWYAVAVPLTLKAGGTYRLSLPASAAVAFPIFSLPRENYTNALPEDWPADDRDGNRQRMTLWPQTDFPIPVIEGARAWQLALSPPPRA